MKAAKPVAAPLSITIEATPKGAFPFARTGSIPAHDGLNAKKELDVLASMNGVELRPRGRDAEGNFQFEVLSFHMHEIDNMQKALDRLPQRFPGLGPIQLQQPASKPGAENLLRCTISGTQVGRGGKQDPVELNQQLQQALLDAGISSEGVVKSDRRGGAAVYIEANVPAGREDRFEAVVRSAMAGAAGPKSGGIPGAGGGIY